MAIKRYKPTSPARRFMSVSAFDEITSTKPERSLLDTQSNQVVEIIMVESLLDISAVVIDKNTELSISRETKITFLQKLLKFNTIQIVQQISHCYTMQMAQKLTSWHQLA